jgi:mono/diheme cytochrome c family protein
MPPFGEQLTDDEIDRVIQYVRTFAMPAKTAKKQ